MRDLRGLGAKFGVTPHPEERRLRRVSKDEAAIGASWFETAQGRLLTMRSFISPGCGFRHECPPAVEGGDFPGANRGAPAKSLNRFC
jgi:hypothetical protein